MKKLTEPQLQQNSLNNHKNNSMTFIKVQKARFTLIIIISMIFLSSCLTSKKIDTFIADEYNGQIPKIEKKIKPSDITITSINPSTSTNISSTEVHTKVLPLIVYWSIDYRHTSTLNTQIAVTNFAKAINAPVNKTLLEKLEGQKLELTVEQVPATFALVEKTHVIWLIYPIHWDKIYIEPTIKDLVVSYKLYKKDGNLKTGSITIKNEEKNKGLRFFQSWKSAISEYIINYDRNIVDMSKQLVNKLLVEK